MGGPGQTTGGQEWAAGLGRLGLLGRPGLL